MCKLIFTCGLPRSGKSSFCREWAEYQDYGEWIDREIIKEKRVVVSGDSVRLALHGNVYHKEAESTVFAHLEVFIRALLDEGHTVCFDECNTSIASLYGIFKLDLDAHIQYFNTSEEVCIERAKALRQDYLIPVIKRASRNLGFLSHIGGIEVIRRYVKNGLTFNETFDEISATL